MHKLFKSKFFDFEAVRLLGESAYGGSDVAEFLEAVGQIKDDDPVSWHEAWSAQAVKAEATAQEALASGDRVAARRAFLRASNYTRASGYMFTGSARFPDPRSLTTNERVIHLFRKAITLFDGEVRVLGIPYDGYLLPAYLYLPPQERRLPGRRTPLLINSGGADSIQEELFYMSPAAGPDLGYAVLTFEGPGQGIMLRKHGLRMRPDWEVVTSQVLDFACDYAAAYPELNIDIDKIAVSGASMGGYYALRAAADPRVKACVSIDPFYDMWDFGTGHINKFFIMAWTSGLLGDGIVNAIIAAMGRWAFQLRWEVAISGTFFGIDAPTAILREMAKYTLKTDGGRSSYLEGVRCPVFISGARDSLYLDVDTHPVRVFNALSNQQEDEKELWLPRTPGEGALQAKMGALPMVNQKTYQFLDRIFGIQRDLTSSLSLDKVE